jgi:uracil-DNA glycosylase
MPKSQNEIAACRSCPRLVAWREGVAENPPKRYAGENYWARPVPSWGELSARLLIVGLAPAAHGGNRTGRVFTGDRSGDWLFRSMHRAGFCNQPTSININDGLELIDCYIAAAVHCAPPDNKPLPEEFRNCRPYLLEELQQLKQLRVIVGLGKIGFDAAWESVRDVGLLDDPKMRRPRFGHGVEVNLSTRIILLGTYHPSQQNTFTGKLTEEMLDAVFMRAKELIFE